MDLNKHLSFFNPTELRKKEINIIGCGALGSNVALQLAKLGIESLTIWDFDMVCNHNVTNQLYDTTDIGMLKTDALEKHLKRQNPEIKIVKKKKYTTQALKGIVILCVDSIEVRHHIADYNKYNIMINLLIDGRMGLKQGQIYVIDWSSSKNIEKYLALTDFKDNEAEVEMSPCGTTLSVSPSVLMIVSAIVTTIILYAKNEPYASRIMIDTFNYRMLSI